MAYSEMLRRVTLIRTDISEEFSASIIRVTRIGELGTTLAVTSSLDVWWDREEQLAQLVPDDIQRTARARQKLLKKPIPMIVICCGL
jgi:hypothetical protein